MKRLLSNSAVLACVIAGTLFATSSAQAGEVRRILENGEGRNISVTVRNAPTIDGKKIRIINTFESRWPDTKSISVELTGKTENGWAEILHPTNAECDKHRHPCQQIQGWIFGEFVGVLPENAEYVLFVILPKNTVYVVSEPKSFRIIRDRALGRLSDTVLADHHEHYWDSHDYTKNPPRCCSYTFKKEDRVTVIGKKGRWFEVSAINGKPHRSLWVYDELVEPVS